MLQHGQLHKALQPSKDRNACNNFLLELPVLLIMTSISEVGLSLSSEVLIMIGVVVWHTQLQVENGNTQHATLMKGLHHTSRIDT